MKRLIAFVLALPVVLASSHAAYATGGVYCESDDGKAAISIGYGRLPIFAPLKMHANLGEKYWSSNPREGEIQIGGHQGMFEKSSLKADFTDDNVMEIIISLHVDYSGEETERGFKGKLTFKDVKPFDVFCEFE